MRCGRLPLRTKGTAGACIVQRSDRLSLPPSSIPGWSQNQLLRQVSRAKATPALCPLCTARGWDVFKNNPKHSPLNPPRRPEETTGFLGTVQHLPCPAPSFSAAGAALEREGRQGLWGWQNGAPRLKPAPVLTDHAHPPRSFKGRVRGWVALQSLRGWTRCRHPSSTH